MSILSQAMMLSNGGGSATSEVTPVGQVMPPFNENGDYVDDVFSTHLYTGNGATQTINNGIALAGGFEGGTVLQLSADSVTAGSQNNVFLDSFRPYAPKIVSTRNSLLATAVGIPLQNSTFTLEFWVKINGTGRTFVTVGLYGDDPTFGLSNYQCGSNQLRMFKSPASSTIVTYGGITSSSTVDGWMHVAMVKPSASINSVYFYLDGTYAYSFSINAIPVNPIVKVHHQHETLGLDCEIKRFYITRDVKYTSNFIPQLQEVLNENSLLLLAYRSPTLLDESKSLVPLTNVSTTVSSDSGVLVTRYGNTTQGTFSPFAKDAGKWSNYFDGNGTGGYLSIANTSTLNLNSTAFSVEYWIYLTASSQTSLVLGKHSGYTVNPLAGWCMWVDAGKPTFGVNGAYNSLVGGVLSINTWHHIAATSDGSTYINLYVNGVRVATTSTIVTTATALPFVIGGNIVNTTWNRSYYLSGHTTNIRIIKGTSLTSGTTYPVLTSPLTAVAGTVLLTCQDNRFKDNSSYNHTLTPYGNVKVNTFSPYQNAIEYKKEVHGGSGYFDGTGDYLRADVVATSIPNNSIFTLEFWGYNNNTALDDHYYVAFNKYSGASNTLLVGTRDLWVNGSKSTITPIASLASWNYYTVTYDGLAVKLYINGSLYNVVATSALNLSDCVFAVGTEFEGSNGTTPGNYLNGYVSDIRLTIGNVLYTSNFTVPTAPLTPVANTSLLLNFTNAGITDSTGTVDIETVGNVSVSTTTFKNGTGSLYFDGTGDYLSIPASSNFAFGTGDFTVETWVYANESSTKGIVSTATITKAGFSMSMDMAWLGTNTATSSYAWTLPTATWVHLAISRNNGMVSFFVNGIVMKTVSDPSNLISSTLKVGERYASGNEGYSFNGYIDDLRITKGKARYTSNFIPPTQLTKDTWVNGKDGMVWTKRRNNIGDPYISDTVRGAYNGVLLTDSNLTQFTSSTAFVTSFNKDGFSIGNDQGINKLSDSYVSWTFAKAPKFFDVVTYTGNGATNRVLSHSLNCEVGMITVKATSTTGDWLTYHRSATGDLKLNLTGAQTSSKTLIPSATTSTFTVNSSANTNGVTYVAYLYAHDSSSSGIIQCGSFTTDGSGNATVNLGWEPQYILYKRSSSTGNWTISDVMRGASANSTNNVRYLTAESSAAEADTSWLYSTSTGFTGNANNIANTKFIYLAIRRPNKTPTSGRDVYNASNVINDFSVSNFPVDLVLSKQKTGNNGWRGVDRLRGSAKPIRTNASDAENSEGFWYLDDNLGVRCPSLSTISGYFNYMFKRAPGFFDNFCYTGTGVNRSINHNLGVKPDLLILKSRSSTNDWQLWFNGLSATEKMVLNSTAAKVADATLLNSTLPTSTLISLGTQNAANTNAATYVGYAFANLTGIQSIGTYVGNGTSQTINCGFSAGVRFFLCKAVTTTGSYWVFDSTRGIVAGTDFGLQLNTAAAEVTSADAVDPTSVGVVVNQEATCSINANGVTYMYWAIA